jgi:polysaccharide pyruvyl transferase WcaK-like protein
MIYDMMHVCLAGKPLVLWSQTVGPLEFSDWKWERAVRCMLRQVARICPRDETSVEVLRDFGVDEDRIKPTYESVIGPNDEVESHVPPSHRAPVMGVGIYNAEHRTSEEHCRYVQAIAAIADHAAQDGLRVLFFPHEMQGAGVDDRRTIREIISIMRRSEVAGIVDEDLDPLDHLRRVAECRLFLGHKTHSVVFALTVGTPLLALAYHPKTVDFMRQYGLDEHCIRDEDLTVERAHAVYSRLKENLDATALRQFEKSRELGAVVREDFGRILHKAAAGHLRPFEKSAGSQRLASVPCAPKR